MSNFIKRSVSALVFVIVLLGCSYVSQELFACLFFLITLVGVKEYFTLLANSGDNISLVYPIIVSSVLYLTFSLFYLGRLDASYLLLNLPLLFSVFVYEMYRKATIPFTNIAIMLTGVLYIALPFALLNGVASSVHAYSYKLVFGIFFILWANDSGAYIVGSIIGRTKLFPRISPGKTWEGFIGGAIVAFVITYLIHLFWFDELTLENWLVVASILVFIGTLGDLVESMLKRSVGVKDSGNIMPGHGGILDRFDSLLFSSPFLFVYLNYIQ